MDDATVYAEDVISHMEDVTSQMEDSIDHTATVSAHLAPVTINPLSILPRLPTKNGEAILLFEREVIPRIHTDC